MLLTTGFMMMNKKCKDIVDYFNTILKDARCELNYTKDYELLIAVMLSAQTTDKSVNKVTSVLFNKYQTLDELNNASLDDICDIIKPIGLYKNKAINLKEIVKSLINDYDYKVPREKEELVKLKGVGVKTANVVRIEIFKESEFPVDTHVNRIAKRLGFANEKDDVAKVEEKLKKQFPKDLHAKLHHQFIHFGRYYCMAKNPKCEGCVLSKYCNFIKKKY